jgi:glycosyltransferase involved in cell wall biosynthesis
MLSVIAYTGGYNSPSRVFRVQQYIGPLKTSGIDMRECASRAGMFPPAQKWLRPFWGLWNLSERGLDTLRSTAYDLVFFQREMLSTFVTWEPFAKRPRVFDIDDAIWIYRGGHYAGRLARACDHIICGNRFLAEHFSRWNPNVSILPTSVDVHVFCPRSLAEGEKDERFIIGWMGLACNLRLLYGIEKALGEVLRRHPRSILRIVTSEAPKFRSLPGDRIEYIRWTPQNEARTIREMTIGIMPLDDTILSQGKCSYKMLLYMASGLPVVVSPIGMNQEVLEKDEIGFGAACETDWVDHLDRLLRDGELRRKMGAAGRQVVLQHYSVEALAPQLAKTLRSVAG